MWFLKLSTTLAIGGLRTVANAWALMTLWGWFVVPLGVTPISLWHAAGLDLMAALVFILNRGRPAAAEESSWGEDIGWSIAKLIIGPFAVGIGWLIQGLM